MPPIKNGLRVLVPLAALAVAACQPDADSPGTPGEGRLNVGVQGLTLDAIQDACYSLTATNGVGDVVWTQAGVCADLYGNGTSDITYIGPCDASEPATTVTLVLDELYDAAGAPIPASEYANPCTTGSPCSQTVNCVENADTLVNFDLTLLVDGDRGFVDVAVNIDYLYCSAKLDCVDGSGGALNLLHNPATGERDQTVVLAVDCRPSACVDPTYFYASDIVITCDDGTATVFPSAPGPLNFVGGGLDLFAAFLYQGQDALGNGMYNNVAIGIHPGTSCTLTARATASDQPFAGGVIPDGHPYIQWDIPLSDAAGDLVCAQHPLHGVAGGVFSAYPAPGDAPLPHESIFANDCGGGGPVDPPSPSTECPATVATFCGSVDALACPDIAPGACQATYGDGIVTCVAEACAFFDCANAEGSNLECVPGVSAIGYNGVSCVVEGDALNTCLSGGPGPGAVCGDGIVDPGESCDDGNLNPGDGCDASCQLEAPPAVCGDGIVGGGEACDDGNPFPGDGCDETCGVEPGFVCVDSPSLCFPGFCGDGIVDPGVGEECDDGNNTPGDGCNEICLLEP